MQPNKEKEKETYIGDGVYASFDGYMIKLRIVRNSRDETIFLEEDTYEQLVKYAKSHWNTAK